MSQLPPIHEGASDGPRRHHDLGHEPGEPRADALHRWLRLEETGAADEACEAVLYDALGGYSPFAPLPGFCERVISAALVPTRARSLVRQWGWRVAVALVAVQSALLLGLLGATTTSLVDRLGPSGLVAGLARGALLSGRSLAELLHFGRSLSDASRVIGSALATPGLMLLLFGCLAASALGGWLLSSQLSRDDRGMAGALS